MNILINKLNRRKKTLAILIFSIIIMMGIVVLSFILSDDKISTHLDSRNLSPSIEHPFGTDWLGRDMFVRTVKGLSLSLGIGAIAAFISVIIALIFGMASATMGKIVDNVITWIIDLFLAMPHLVMLILIAFIIGGGAKGVIIGVAFTHWTSLARVIRAEILSVLSSDYIKISKNLGKGRWWIASRHILPHVISQFFVGLVLLFPHAILHEASITFLGFGLSPHHPAIGIILSESMKYLSQGLWWLAFFPGISLVIIVRLFDIIGENLKLLIDPYNSHN